MQFRRKSVRIATSLIPDLQERANAVVGRPSATARTCFSSSPTRWRKIARVGRDCALDYLWQDKLRIQIDGLSALQQRGSWAYDYSLHLGPETGFTAVQRPGFADKWEAGTMKF